MNTFDFQIQTTASDGKHTPRECVQMAKEQGVQVMAITDHDTVGGVREALRAGEEFEVHVIPGIEMSVEEHDSHILGYGIDIANETMLGELAKFRAGRIVGAKKMVENLQREGFVVVWEDVLREATGGVIARPHIARAILSRPENKEKLGPISTVHDFIEKFISNENPNYVRRTHISAKDAIALLHGAGGIAIWSHPAIHFRNNYEGLEDFLKELLGWGIDGVEIFNPSHSEDDSEFLESLGKRYKLLRTAGSDFHEKAEHSPDRTTGLHSANTVGDYETHGFSTEDIVTKLDEAIEKVARLKPSVMV